MFRVGLVQAQDTANCRVRVKFPDRHQVVSYWLPIVVMNSQNNKSYYLPDIGEQVVCTMDEHDEDGAVLGAIYSSVDTTPVNSANKWHVTIKDGATFEYDRNSHVLAISLPSSSTFTLQANGATIQIDASGNINLTAAGNITLVTNSHNDSVNNMIQVYNTHTHSDPSEGNTGIPNQTMS